MTDQSNTLDVKVEHLFAASPEQVYNAWLNPDLIRKWFGPGLGQTEPVEVDARVGGSFRIVQIRDGQPVGHSGEYLNLERPTHLAFTWATDDDDGYSTVSITIEPASDGSSVRLVHAVDAQWREYEDRIRYAWTSMMNEMDTITRI